MALRELFFILISLVMIPSPKANAGILIPLVSTDAPSCIRSASKQDFEFYFSNRQLGSLSFYEASREVSYTLVRRRLPTGSMKLTHTEKVPNKVKWISEEDEIVKSGELSLKLTEGVGKIVDSFRARGVSEERLERMLKVNQQIPQYRQILLMNEKDGKTVAGRLVDLNRVQRFLDRDNLSHSYESGFKVPLFQIFPELKASDIGYKYSQKNFMLGMVISDLGVMEIKTLYQQVIKYITSLYGVTFISKDLYPTNYMYQKEYNPQATAPGGGLYSGAGLAALMNMDRQKAFDQKEVNGRDIYWDASIEYFRQKPAKIWGYVVPEMLPLMRRFGFEVAAESKEGMFIIVADLAKTIVKWEKDLSARDPRISPPPITEEQWENYLETQAFDLL